MSKSISTNRPDQFIKKCRVCGEMAAGFGYSGLCCNPCKLFFYRNGHNIHKLHCTKGGQCEIDSSKRRACPKCRLSKCFQIGMKPKSRHHDDNNQNNKLALDSTQCLRSVLEVDCNDNDNDNLPICSLSPFALTLFKKKESLCLAPYEREIIYNIQSVLSSTFVNERSLKIAGKITTVADAFNSTAWYAKSIVQFCKNIPTFKQLNQADQLAVLKPFYNELMLVRLSFLVDCDKSEYPVIENESASQALVIDSELTPKFKNQVLIKQNKQFQLSLNAQLEKDLTIRDLLIALLMFQPRENLTCSEFIRYKYYVHSHLLRRYLEHKYHNKLQATRKHLTLIKLSRQFGEIHENTRKLLLSEIDLCEVSQILVEVFNLNDT